MTKSSQGDMLLYRSPLSETSTERIHNLIEKCIDAQRRLENAMQYIDEKNYEEAAIMIDDTRKYRRVIVEDLVKTYESTTVLENIRIVEKAMNLMNSRIDRICIIAGNEDSRSI